MMKKIDRETGEDHPTFIQPLTSARQAIYVAHLLDPSQYAYNIGHYREVDGYLDVDCFSQSVDLVLSKTPAYRSIVKIENDVPYLDVRPSANSALQLVDFSQEVGPEAAAIAWMDQERKLPFDLTKGPLFRYVLIRLGSDWYFIFTCLHHLIVDGAGLFQFERNVFDIYSAIIRGQGALAPDGADRALELEQCYFGSEQFLDDQAFWRKELDGVEPQVGFSGALLAKTKLFHRSRVELSAQAVRELKLFCKINKIALSRALIAIASLYYARMTSQLDVVIEIPVSLRKTPEDRTAIDMRSSSIFLRLELNPSMSMGEFLQYFQKKCVQR